MSDDTRDSERMIDKEDIEAIHMAANLLDGDLLTPGAQPYLADHLRQIAKACTPASPEDTEELEVVTWYRMEEDLDGDFQRIYYAAKAWPDCIALVRLSDAVERLRAVEKSLRIARGSEDEAWVQFERQKAKTESRRKESWATTTKLEDALDEIQLLTARLQEVERERDNWEKNSESWERRAKDWRKENRTLRQRLGGMVVTEDMLVDAVLSFSSRKGQAAQITRALHSEGGTDDE